MSTEEAKSGRPHYYLAERHDHEQDGTTQNVRSAPGSHGFALLRNREEEFEKKTAIALDLLQAKPVSGGTHNVVLNPDLSGVFTHEAFGHFSEADLIEDSPTMRDRMQIGSQLGNEALSITDDPTMPLQLGFYCYDDEGRARPVALVKQGCSQVGCIRGGRLLFEKSYWHCVAEDYRFAPIVRMGIIH
jgi:TldD protein